MEFGLPEDNNNISLKKFESMLKTNTVLFFDSDEFGFKKLKIKVFEINYEKFNKSLND